MLQNDNPGTVAIINAGRTRASAMREAFGIFCEVCAALGAHVRAPYVESERNFVADALS